MDPFILGVNLLFIRPRFNRGTLSYVRNVLTELNRREDVRLVLFTTQDNETLFRQLTRARFVQCPIRGANRAVRISYEQLFLARQARRQGCDVLFCPGYLAPVFSPLPVVVTIHDMQFMDVPETTSLATRLVYRLILPRAARRAAAILTVSAFSKQRIVELLGLRSEAVFVTHEGPLVTARTEPASRESDSRALSRYGLDKPYLLSVSTDARHKNVSRLIEGFLRFRRQTGANVDAVFVGHLTDTLRRRFATEDARSLRFLGYVDDRELQALYRRATAFALASYYEGFGLPVLEAMQMGVPVACSRAASLPEVAGPAAVLFDPFDPASIADALEQVVLDPEERQRLVAAGHERVQQFQWSRCAQDTLAVLRSAGG